MTKRVSKPIDAALRAALARPPQRIQPLTVADGRRVWLKRVEQVSGRLRLQKGDGKKGFEAERRALHVLQKTAVPVPDILAEGPDYLLLPDLGPTLAALVRDPAHPPADRKAAFAAAGTALADLHREGFAHGRPALRDFCWQNGALTLIDLERFRNRQRGRTLRAVDLVIFTHSWFATAPDMPAGTELHTALRAYRAAAPAGVWSAIPRLLPWLSPLAALARARIRRGKAALDVQAVPPTIAYLTRVTRDAR